MRSFAFGFTDVMVLFTDLDLIGKFGVDNEDVGYIGFNAVN